MPVWYKDELLPAHNAPPQGTGQGRRCCSREERREEKSAVEDLREDEKKVQQSHQDLKRCRQHSKGDGDAISAQRPMWTGEKVRDRELLWWNLQLEGLPRGLRKLHGRRG